MNNLLKLVESALLESDAVAYARCDLEGLVGTCNPAMARVLGLSSPMLVGQMLWDYLEHPIATGPHQIVRLRTAAGVAAQLSRSESGYVLLVKTETLREQFLAHISHEIRTPLNAIMGMSHLLESTHLTGQQREYLRYLVAGSQGLLRIFNELLDSAQMVSGQLTLGLKEFSLESVCDGLLRQLADRAQQKGLQLNIRLHSLVPTRVLGDPVRLSQMLLLLLDNAIKFTPRGEVSLLVARPSGSPTPALEFTVRDTGIGIGPELCSNLFRPGVQADASLTRQHGGAGMGLSLCRQLVELMDGQINLQSQPGQGTIVTVRLPLATTALGTEQSAVQRLRPGGVGARVLVVEDNLINQRIVSELLRGAGLEVDIAGNGLEALDRVRDCGPTSPWRVILMDLQMPLMDGHSACRAIRQDARFDDVPVIAMTAHVLPAERERCRITGMDEFLCKPIDPETWHRVLRLWLPLPEQSVFLKVGGLDFADGLKRSLGNAPFYHSLLLGFAARLSGLREELSTALAHFDRKRLQFLAHSLQGEAGNLGALEVSRQARIVGEVAARQGDAELTSAVANLLEALAGAQQDLSRQLSLDCPAETVGAVMEWTEAQLTRTREAVAKLARLLEANDGESLDCLHGLRGASPTLAGSGQLMELERLVLQFDFDRALLELRSLEARLPLRA